ncbi:hypothetical protein FRC19_010043 [Serendipita sp. 401]|nr:hypothetical protein FRC19_010043 [Serendipita sp. 401]
MDGGHYKIILASSFCPVNIDHDQTSKYSKLQPSFPETPDELLFEECTDEYSALDGLLSKDNQPRHTKPCDSLAAAAAAADLSLGKALLEEYTAAKIQIIHRSQYRNLALLSLRAGDIDGSLAWLSLMPSQREDATTSYQEPTQEMVDSLTDGRLEFRGLITLLGIYAEKGWQGSVPLRIISILAKYRPVMEFYELFTEVTGIHQEANKGEDVKQLHTQWRAAAIYQLASRNKPSMAWRLFREQPDELSRLNEEILIPVYRSAYKKGLPFAPFILEAIPPHLRSRVKEGRKILLSSTKLTQEVLQFKLADQGGFLSVTKGYAEARLSRSLRILKWLLVNPGSQISPDPRAVAYAFFALSTSSRGERVLNLFRKRIARLGDHDAHVFWATVEMELLRHMDDPGSAAQYYIKAFHPPGIPSVFRQPPPGHWQGWLSTTPLRSPPLPPYRLRPSGPALLTIWKIAITLSLRLEDDFGVPNFSPAALRDTSMYGRRALEGTEESSITLPYKVFDAYVYGFRQLSSIGATREAVELHARMLRFGYKEGTSLLFDGLLHAMLEEMRVAARKDRNGGENSSYIEARDIEDAVFSAELSGAND